VSGRPRNRTSLAGFGDQPDPRSPPSGVDGGTRTRLARVHSAWARLFALVHSAPARNRTEPGRLSSGCTTFVLRAHGSRWLELPQRPPVPETGAHLTELHPERCPRLGSNQHLPVFSRAPSPDRLRGRVGGRGGARPRASSTIRLSENDRSCSGTRTRTSICRVKACWPPISRSPNGLVPGPGFEPGFLRSERRGLPLADPGGRRGGLPGTRTPLARVRTECFAVKACCPDLGVTVPSVGFEPTQAGLKGRCPSRWATTANEGRRSVCRSPPQRGSSSHSVP
jgi:hypothetical protein